MAVPISNVTRRVVYAASGTGPYAFTFEILANTDIAVFRDDTLLTLTTDYTVTIAANGTGSITLVAAPTGATQIAIVGNRTIQRTTDFVTGGDFFANTVNDEMDQQTIFAQQNAEGLQRALQAPQTDPTTINMVLPRATLRANKVLSFDSTGNPNATEFIGSNRGNWTSGTLYYVRDIVKDTSNNNIYQCSTQHTASGSQPISTNTDSGKWALLVDAASATAAQTAAEAAQAAAETAEANAETAETNAETAETNAETAATAAASSASAASTSASNASSSASTASTAATNAGNSATAAATSATNASNSASSASTSASNASSSASSASTSASNASTSATNAANSATAASGSASTASTQATNAASSATAAAGSATSAASAQTAAEAARDATLAAYDNFDDRYLGAKSSDPTVDNDGNALVAGSLYFNTVSGGMKVYTGSAWVAAYISGSGYLAAANNLSDVADTATARSNIGAGDVVGPASSTDNAFTRFDGTTGKLIQNSTGATLSDTGGATFTGSVDVAGTSTAGSNIKLYEDTDNGTNYVSFKAPDTIAANVTWTLPSADGTNTQVLQTNGSGVLSFATVSGGASAATPTALGTVYGKTDTGSISFLGYQAGNSNTGTSNTGVGYRALYTNTSGSNNVAVGDSAAYLNSTAQGLVAIGRLALYNTTASHNIAIGFNTMYSNTSGTYNLAVGPYDSTTYPPLYSNTTGANNVGLGAGALAKNTTASNNTAVGYQAAYTNSTGVDITAVGWKALINNTTGQKNTAVGGGDASGYASLANNNTGSYNTAVGNAAGAFNTTGTYNTALGYQAMYANTTAYFLTAIGYQAGYSFNKTSNTYGYATAVGYKAANANSTGALTAIGANVLLNNTTGEANVGVGGETDGASAALKNNTTGYNNTAVGVAALQGNTTGYWNACIGLGALSGVTNGYYNIALGGNAGNNLTTGSNCIFLGTFAQASNSAAQNETVFAGLTGKGNNTTYIGGSSGVYNQGNTTTFTTTSDQRLKKNIVNNDVGLEKLAQIQVRNFEYRTAEEITELPTHTAIEKTGVQLGVIAQELQVILPECVKQESTGVLRVDADNLTWYLINAVKELSARVKQLEGN